MSRAMWTGMLSFGLVSIPVGLHGATQAHELEFTSSNRAPATGSATSGSTSAPRASSSVSRLWRSASGRRERTDD